MAKCYWGEKSLCWSTCCLLYSEKQEITKNKNREREKPGVENNNKTEDHILGSPQKHVQRDIHTYKEPNTVAYCKKQ